MSDKLELSIRVRLEIGGSYYVLPVREVSRDGGMVDIACSIKTFDQGPRNALAESIRTGKMVFSS